MRLNELRPIGRRSFLFSTLFFAAVLTTQADAPPATGQDTTSRRFQTALNTVADAEKITIIAEGYPFTFDSAVTQTDTCKSASAPRKIDILAKAGDYAVKNSRGAFLLTKQYSDPHDTPCVTIEECRQSMKRIQAELEKLMPPVAAINVSPDEARVQNFFRSLSAEQLKQAKDTPFLIAKLSPAQKQVAVTMFTSTYLDLFHDAVDTCQDTLEHLSEATLGTQEFNERLVLVWRSPKSPQFYHVMGNPGFDRPINDTTPRAGDVQPDDSTPTTLGKEFARLTARAKTLFDAGLAFSDKPLTVAGMDRLAPEQAAYALAAVYDLGVRVTGDTRHLTPRPRPTTITVFTIRDAVSAMLPAPIARVMTSNDPMHRVEPELTVPGYGQSAGYAPEHMTILFLDEAVRLLCWKHERQWNSKPPKENTVAELDSQDRQALATAALGNLLHPGTSLLNDSFPDYIEHFDKVSFTCERYLNEQDGKMKIKMDFSVPFPGDPKQLMHTLGFGNVADVETPAPPASSQTAP